MSEKKIIPSYQYIDGDLREVLNHSQVTGQLFIYCSGAEARCRIPKSIADSHSIICHGATSEVVIEED